VGRCLLPRTRVEPQTLSLFGRTATYPTLPHALRYGVEITNHYSPHSWLHFNGDVALVRARYRGVDQQQALTWLGLLAPGSISYGMFIGNAAGNFIPEAKSIVATAGVEIGDKSGWFGAVKYRYFGAQPLTKRRGMRRAFAPHSIEVTSRPGLVKRSGCTSLTIMLPRSGGMPA
jgi:hypothetical protein